MQNNLRLLFLSLALFLAGELQGENLPKEEPKHNLSICAIFHNESHFLKEWIEYHLLIGIDHFYLYNVGSKDHFMKVLAPYIKDEIVTLVNWIDINPQITLPDYQWSLGIQIPAYENAILIASGKTKWLTFMDINEFLVSPISDLIPEVLAKHESFPGVALTCDFFDASKNAQMLPRRKLLIQTVELTKPFVPSPEREITKVIFKPEHCKGFYWPPYRCVFKNLQVAQNIARSQLRVNNYLNRNAYSPFKKMREKLHVDNRLLSENEKAQILSLDYEIEDQESPIARFIPELAEKLGYHLNWGW